MILDLQALAVTRADEQLAALTPHDMKCSRDPWALREMRNGRARRRDYGTCPVCKKHPARHHGLCHRCKKARAA